MSVAGHKKSSNVSWSFAP